MNTAIDEITRFQLDRELHMQPYNPINEHTNIVEELLESVGFDVAKDDRDRLMRQWDSFIILLVQEGIIHRDSDHQLTLDDEIDAYGDVIVFAIGAITKLGYNPEMILTEIAKEINSRTGSMVNGKFEKNLSAEAKSKWYKADFKYASLEGITQMQKRRKAFFASEGYMGSEDEVETWVKSLS